MPKRFSVWNWIHFFQSKEGNECERSVWLSIFFSPFKNCFPTKIPCQTISVFDFEYTFFDQRKEMFVKEDYQFLSPFIKKYIPTSTYTTKSFSIWNWIHFFKQRNEMNVKEVYDYQFLSPFEKCIPTKTSMPKVFIVWKWIKFFQPMELNVWENKVSLSIFVTF